jgi:hypothetical protein
MAAIPRILIGFAACVLLPAAALGQKVTYDNYGAKDFSHLRTYAFKTAAPDDSMLEKSSTYDDPFVRQRTWDAVAAQLNARGMTRNDEHPDVYVIARRSFKEQTIYYPYAWDWGYPYGWGWGWGWSGAGWGWGYGGAYPVEIIRGTLIIDLQDAATGELLWRGVGQREVHPMSKPSSRTKRVNNEVSKIFKHFPTAGAVATTGHDVPKPR